MRILGIETSCDETAAAIVASESGVQTILSSEVATQAELHSPFGGVVPEIACRAHAERIAHVVRRAMAAAGTGWGALDAIAVTTRPGLVGALMVGVSAAKALALATGLPLVPVDHIEGHVHAVSMEHPGFPFPNVTLVASGGHTRLYEVVRPGEIRVLGSTFDDAAGEAFDKVAALLGLGYPGGPAIERAARDGDPERFRFPRSTLGADSLDFSFSGIKTAVLYLVKGQDGTRSSTAAREAISTADVAASFQRAVVETLVEKILRALRRTGGVAAAIAGGVACNRELRSALDAAASREGFRAAYPRSELCTDNAAMIAGLGAIRFAQGEVAGLDLEVA